MLLESHDDDKFRLETSATSIMFRILISDVALILEYHFNYVKDVYLHWERILTNTTPLLHYKDVTLPDGHGSLACVVQYLITIMYDRFIQFSDVIVSKAIVQ